MNYNVYYNLNIIYLPTFLYFLIYNIYHNINYQTDRIQYHHVHNPNQHTTAKNNTQHTPNNEHEKKTWMSSNTTRQVQVNTTTSE